MKYYNEVEAIQLQEDVYDSSGKLVAKKEDWLIVDGNTQYYLSNEEFTRKFKLILGQCIPYPYPYINPWPYIGDYPYYWDPNLGPYVGDSPYYWDPNKPSFTCDSEITNGLPNEWSHCTLA